MNLNLYDRVNTIRTRDDFVEFVRDLTQDLWTNPGDWENPGLDSYLETLGAWVNDMDGYFQNRGEPVPKQASWKLLGEILLAARIYE
ncbi:MAG: hypothetical protein ABI353_03625 [Isosphaeraceae bacterium]